MLSGDGHWQVWASLMRGETKMKLQIATKSDVNGYNNMTIQKGRQLMQVRFDRSGPHMIRIVTFEQDTPAHLQAHPFYGSVFHVQVSETMAGKYIQI